MATCAEAVESENILRGLECPICQEYFREPRMLPCGHTLCLKPCLEEIAGRKSRVRCAECRKEHPVPVGGVQNFPQNVAISRQTVTALKIPRGRDCSRLTSCPICGEEDDLRKCGHCEIFLCYTCVTQHLPKLKQKVQLVASEIDDQANNALQVSVHAETAARLLMKQNADASLAEVDLVTNRALTLIEARAQQLKTQVRTSHQQDIENLTANARDASRRLLSLQQRCTETITDMRNENSTFTPTKLVKIIDNLKSESNRTLKSKEDFNLIETCVIETDFEALERALKKFAVVKLTDPLRTDRTASSGSRAHNQAIADCEPRTQDQVKVGCGPRTQDQVASMPLKHPEGNTRLLSDSILCSADIKIKMRFGTEGSRPGQFSNPWAIAVDAESGDIVVADTGNHRIQRFDSTGKLCVCFGSKGSGPLQFSSPFALAINRIGQMIISDKENNRIKVHNKDGSVFQIIGAIGSESGLLKRPFGLVLDINENIHMCDLDDMHDDSVRIMRQDGTHVGQYNTPDCPSPVIISSSPSGVTCVSDEDTCVVFNDQLQQQSSWDFDGVVCGICVDDGGRVLASDIHNNKLLLYRLNGELLKEVFDFSSDNPFHQPRGVTIDKYGSVYVACSSAVLKF